VLKIINAENNQFKLNVNDDKCDVCKTANIIKTSGRKVLPSGLQRVRVALTYECLLASQVVRAPIHHLHVSVSV
jgi:hypothetical protein